MTKRKRTDSSDSNSIFPTLVHLACHHSARGLWQHVIKQSTLPTELSKFDQSFVERCRNEILVNLDQISTKIPSHCKVTIAAQVNSLMRDIIDEFSSLNISRLMSHILETPKWNDFLSSVWSCVKDKVPEQRIMFMFEWIALKVNKIGFEAIPEDELIMYLEIWTNLPNHLKLSIFENLSYYYSRKNWRFGALRRDVEWISKLKTLPRDLRFLQKLFADFDLTIRKQIWRENWIYLIFGASLTSLDSLMKMCCEVEDDIEQFKNAWLTRNEIIDHYYCSLIEWKCYDELNQFLSFYSTVESKILDLAGSILHSYFSRNMVCYLPVNGYNDIVEIARSGGWLERAIKMPEFEYHLRRDEVKIKLYCCFLLHKGSFNKMRDFLEFFLPEEEVIIYERRLLRFFFLENEPPIQPLLRNFQLHSTWCFHFLSKLDKFSAFINRILPSANEATAFKKDIIFSRFTFEGLRVYLDKKSKENTSVQKFVMMCLPLEQDLFRWKEKFMEDNLQTIRLSRHLEGLFRTENNIMSWCLDSEEKLTEFKMRLSIHEMFLIMERFISKNSGNVYTLKKIANNILNWWCSSVEEMADFKMNKLHKCTDDDPMLEVLLGDHKNEYLQNEDVDHRRWFVLASCNPH